MTLSGSRTLRLALGALALLCVSAPATGASQSSPPAKRVLTQDQDVDVSWAVRPGPAAGQPDRANFVLEAEPGQTLSDTLEVENLSRVNLVLGVVANDAFNTADGGMDLLASDDEPVDLGAWVSVESRSITVAPGETAVVPFTIEVPDDASPGDHTGGILTTLTMSDTDSTGSRVVHERRLGTRIMVRVDGQLDPRLEFTAMETSYAGTANPFAPGTMTVRYTVENTGNVRLRATQKVTVEGGFGTSRSVDLADLSELLPDNSIEVTAEVPGVWPAFSTTTEVVLDTYEPSGQRLDPEPQPAVARSSTSLVPVPQIVLAILVLAAIAGVVMARTRSKAKLRRAVDEAVAQALRDSGQQQP